MSITSQRLNRLNPSCVQKKYVRELDLSATTVSILVLRILAFPSELISMYCTCTIFYEACFRHYQLNLPLIPFKLDCSKYVLFSERGWQNIHEKTRGYPKPKGHAQWA